MSPKVTVILPSYNHAQFLTYRIDSILNQTFTDFELIIIDDHSSDNSDEIIKSYLSSQQIQYIRNPTNSGSPFSSWEKGCSLARGEYIWICESDDYAENDFLEKAVEALESDTSNVLFYTNSNIVDIDNNIIGNTATYFDEIWKEKRWKKSFTTEGKDELSTYQIMGQTVPNMSSALIRKTAFQKAWISYLKKFKLTGDWLFIGLIMLYGRVVFNVSTLSNFRKHKNTSRERVNSARSQAEFILTKFYLFNQLINKKRTLLDIFAKDVVRSIYEEAAIREILREMVAISLLETAKFSLALVPQLFLHKEMIKKYFHRKKMAKSMSNKLKD